MLKWIEFILRYFVKVFNPYSAARSSYLQRLVKVLLRTTKHGVLVGGGGLAAHGVS